MDDDGSLAFGLDFDRDYLVSFVKRFRECYWPVTVFFVHPFTIFVLIRKSPMSFDCKCAFITHHITLMCFDFYNGALYQMYPLAPIPVFICTGLLCDGAAEGTTLLTGLAFFTISLCVPYLFIMLRMHQKILSNSSPFKLNKKTQGLIMLFLTSLLAANVFGFHTWAVESANKSQIIQKPEIVWASEISTNMLVLGEQEGDVGPFVYELLLLVVSIFVIMSFYIFITYHSVFKSQIQLDLTKNIRKTSTTRDTQLRFVYSLSIQVKIGVRNSGNRLFISHVIYAGRTACCSAVFFILPMLLLFIGLVLVRVRWLLPGWLAAGFRVVMLLAYNCCSIAHSIVYLWKNRWFSEMRKSVGRRVRLAWSVSRITVPPNIVTSYVKWDAICEDLACSSF